MEPNDNNINHKASMAEQQQFPRRMLPRLAPPTPPGIHHRGGNADSTLAPSSSTNFHPLTLPNSATSYNGADATHEHACPCPLAFRLQVEVVRLEMELRKKNMELAEKDTRIKFFEEVLQFTSSSTPVSTNASVRNQLGQLTIGSSRNITTPNVTNNNRRGRSLERASNTLNLNEHLDFSQEELQGRNFLRMAISKDDYEALKKWIHQHGNNYLEMINFIFEELKGYIPKNYVVQCVVVVKQDYADLATEALKGNFVAMSMQKFSSNVVEKILKNASIEKVRDIINEIIEDPNVLRLFQDQFGNFVIQKALTATVKRPSNIFDVIAKVIESNYSILDCHMYGRRVIVCLMRLKNERRSYSLASLEEPSNV
ncbi:hypothetical protein Scep_008214 [Stephania cephalantha]|uniref:PUM-HD domain-containing protein n=1 Tax=Stephania cephalantha TaxID=152367 RepID=A0AAP0KBK3_9MAGN